MMGFSLIFPLFPSLLKYYLSNEEGSFLVSLLLFLPKILSYSPSHPFYYVLVGGIISSVYSFLQFVFSPLWGRLSDKIGRKKILVFTTLGSVLGYILWLFSYNFSFFILSRLLTGVMGGNISVASASMADLSSEKDRAKSMGMIGAGIGLGFIFGPPLGGFLSKVELSFLKGDYLAPYAPAALVSLLIAFINLLLILFYLKESLPQFEKVETHSSKPIHPILGLKKTHLSELPLFCLIFFLYTFAFSGFEFSFNFFLSIVFSLTPSEIGGVFVYLGLLIILVQGGLIRRVSGKISEKKLCLLGGLLLCFGFTLLYFSNTIGFTLFSLFFTAVGSGILNPSLSSLTSLHSSPEEQGTNLGIFRSFGSLARAFAPILYGFLYFNTSHQMVFLSSGVLLFLTLLLVFKIKD